MTASTPNRHHWGLTKETFEKLLNFLGPSPGDAGKKYEEVRLRLIKIFVCRGCTTPEELADETINRVAGKIQAVENSYVGDPALYFYGVARKIFLESVRKKPNPLPRPLEKSPEVKELESQCLDKCMQNLTTRNRNVILEYYQEEKTAKIDHRKALSSQLGIAPNALRILAHRIRRKLKECVFECLDHNPVG